jgi:hypothetical protein
LKLKNQNTLVPLGILKGIPIDLDCINTMAYLEFIDIVDNTTPYPALLGLDWAFDNHEIINLKTRKMIFQYDEYRVIAPLHPSKGGSYLEPTNNILTEDINQLYRTIAREEDYINPTAYGMVSWGSISKGYDF